MLTIPKALVFIYLLITIRIAIFLMPQIYKIILAHMRGYLLLKSKAGLVEIPFPVNFPVAKFCFRYFMAILFWPVDMIKVPGLFIRYLLNPNRENVFKIMKYYNLRLTLI